MRQHTGGPKGRADSSQRSHAPALFRKSDGTDVLTGARLIDQLNPEAMPTPHPGAIFVRTRQDPTKWYVKRARRRHDGRDVTALAAAALEAERATLTREEIVDAMTAAKNEVEPVHLPGLLHAALEDRRVSAPRRLAILVQRFGHRAVAETFMTTDVPTEIAHRARAAFDARLVAKIGWLPRYQLRWIEI